MSSTPRFLFKDPTLDGYKLICRYLAALAAGQYYLLILYVGEQIFPTRAIKLTEYVVKQEYGIVAAAVLTDYFTLRKLQSKRKRSLLPLRRENSRPIAI
jgi:hypothetical protein